MRWRATRAHAAVSRVDGDAVDDPAGDQLLEHPAQVGGVDAEHGRARADQRVERLDRLSRVLGGQPLHQVDLGGDGEDRAGGGPFDRPDDVVGRPDLVGQLDHLVAALGVDDDDAVGVLGPEGGDVLGPEALVHRAVALPQQEAGFLDRPLVEAAEVAAGVPDRHVGRPGSRAGSRCCGRGAGRGRTAPWSPAPVLRRAPRSARPGRWTRCTPRRRGGRRRPSGRPRSSCR